MRFKSKSSMRAVVEEGIAATAALRRSVRRITKNETATACAVAAGQSENAARATRAAGESELEAERQRDEVRVAFVGEHRVEARFDERLEATQVERESAADVQAELGLRFADVEAGDFAGELESVESQAGDGVRPRGRRGIAKRKQRVSEEVDHAGVAVGIGAAGDAVEESFLQAVPVIRDLAAQRGGKGGRLVFDEAAKVESDVGAVAEITERQDRKS